MFTLLLYTGSEQTARVVYYRSAAQEIHLAWMPDQNNKGKWNTEVVQSRCQCRVAERSIQS